MPRIIQPPDPPDPAPQGRDLSDSAPGAVSSALSRRAFVASLLGTAAGTAIGTTGAAGQARDVLTLPPPPPDSRHLYGKDDLQFGELRVPFSRPPYPVMIVIHGGYWRAAYDLKHVGHLCAKLTAKGIATWSIEYRRLGNPGGGWPGTFDDVLSSADFIRKSASKFKLDARRIAVMGHSAGGHLALWLAANRPDYLRGAIGLAPIADLKRAFELNLSRGVVAELLGGAPGEVPDTYAKASPIDLLPIARPQRLIHGVNDKVVPIEISRRYIDAAKMKHSDAKLTEIAECGHYELIDPSSKEWPTVEYAALKLLEQP